MTKGTERRSRATARPSWRLALAAALLVVVPCAAGGAEPEIDLDGLRALDLRLATIAHRLVTANATLCVDQVPAPGLVLHAIDQYATAARPAVRVAFAFPVPVAVEAVVPGSAAAAVPVPANAGIVAMNGVPLATEASTNSTSVTRDAALAVLEAQPADRPLRLRINDAGQERDLTVPAQPGCRSRFELLVGTGLSAAADGSTVQIGTPFLERYRDDQVAVVVAHELAHNILRHRARLDAAKVNRGLLAGVGRSAGLFRRTEDEADLLGLHLLRNAGWDPQAAVRFWAEEGVKIDGGLFRSRTHAGARSRARAIAAELATIPTGAPVPYRPTILTQRDQPLQLPAQ